MNEKIDLNDFIETIVLAIIFGVAILVDAMLLRLLLLGW